MNTNLAFIRNELLKGKCSDEMIDTLEEIKESLIKLNNPFSSICKQAIFNALEDIKQSKLEEAGYQINLIHNMPMDPKDFAKWDESHFYEFELPVFFENTEGAGRIKKMIILLAELARYTG